MKGIDPGKWAGSLKMQGRISIINVVCICHAIYDFSLNKIDLMSRLYCSKSRQARNEAHTCSLSGFGDHLHVVLVLVVHLHRSVTDLWWLHEILVLQPLVVLGELLPLLVCQGEECDFLLF